MITLTSIFALIFLYIMLQPIYKVIRGKELGDKDIFGLLLWIIVIGITICVLILKYLP